MEMLRESFIRFVYPFEFDPETFHARSERVQKAECENLGPIWRHARFPEDELLMHVARYLNPPDATEPTARLWQMTPDFLRSPLGLGGGAKNPGANWSLHYRDRETDFLLEEWQLVLFHTGVGFLIARVRPETTDAAEWMDFLHYFRFLHPSRVRVSANRRTGFDPETKQPIFHPFIPPIASQSSNRVANGHVFRAIVDGLLQTAAFPDVPHPWWSDNYIADQLLPFAAAFMQGVPEAEQNRWLYRFHNFFHRDQGEHASADELKAEQPHRIEYAERQWFVFSLDGGAFVACDPPDTPFFRQTLPDHLDNHYLLVFLLALHQRFALMRFIEQISRKWMSTERRADLSGQLKAQREELLWRVREQFLSFSARGYFAQVMQRRHHHRCYLKWQETFQVERLFQEISSEIKEMHDYLILQDTRQIERIAEETRHLESRLNWMAGLFAVPALVLAYLDAVGNQSWWLASAGLIGGLAGGFGLMLGLQYRRRQRQLRKL